MFSSIPYSKPAKAKLKGKRGASAFPTCWAQWYRKEKITIEAYNLKGEQFVGEVDGLFARIVQHETDHLDGKLFIDRLPAAQAAEVRSELEEFEIDFQSKRDCGEMPSDEAIAERIAELEKLRA